MPMITVMGTPAANTDVAFPSPSSKHVDTFATRGWIAVPDAIPHRVLDDLVARADRIRLDNLGLDWSMRDGVRSERPVDQVLQSMLELDWIDWTDSDFHRWTLSFATALMQAPLALWYDQLLDKPPRVGAPTFWHQDGGLMGDGDGDRLISCWMPLDSVDEDSGCMHFLDGGHREGSRSHEVVHRDHSCGRGPCTVDPTRTIAVPISRGGVVFHHGMMPHMTQANRSDRWRQVLIQRFFVGKPPGAA